MSFPFETRKALLLAAGLIAGAGCRGGQSPGETGTAEEHAGHVIPAHKPKDFPSAVRRLVALNGSISDRLAEGKALSLVKDQTLPIALDIAQWLPEIAADSGMTETPWNRVNQGSSKLSEDYRKILASATIDDRAPGASAWATEAGLTIKDLEAELESADPRWFGPSKPGVNP